MYDNEDEPRPPRKHGTGWPDWMETWVLPYLEDSALWPVAIALLGHVVLLFAVMLLAVWRSGNPFAGFSVFLVASGSVQLVRGEWAARRQLGVVTGTVLVTWLAAAIAAWGLGSLGVL